ncbi:MAG: formate dehydrogenase subunit gamma [Gammaproteobacteria bacterium]|nr:formate dehydrogenase subunit gamma [Gammaproteobacteria bacterium]
MQTPISSCTSETAELLDEFSGQRGALLPILHAVQTRFGYIPPEAIPTIASALQQTAAEIHGVISFYHQFRTTPPGRHRVQICRAEACQARGARVLEQHAKDRLGVDYHQTTADGAVSLDAVYCLGNCATGPNLRIDDKLFGRVDETRFDTLIEQLIAEVQA